MKATPALPESERSDMPSFVIDEIHVGDIVKGDVVLRDFSYGDDPVHTLPYFPESEVVDMSDLFGNFLDTPAIAVPDQAELAPTPVVTKPPCPPVAMPACRSDYDFETIIDAQGCKSYRCVPRPVVNNPVFPRTDPYGDLVTGGGGIFPYISPIGGMDPWIFRMRGAF